MDYLTMYSTLYPLLPKTTSPRITVLGKGNLDAEIALVGEALGQTEESQGEPFVGSAGHFLNLWLENAGINRSDLYITNVVKIRPPFNDLSRLHEYGVSKEAYINLLQKELSMLPNLKVVVALGGLAFETLSGLQSISKWQGSILTEKLTGKELTLIPIKHPSYVQQYEYDQHPVCTLFLQRAWLLSRGATSIPRVEIIKPSLERVVQFLTTCAQSDMFSYDIETAGNQIICIGFALSKDLGVCIPLKNGYSNYWTYSEEMVVWEHIGRALASSALKIGQYKQYDDTWLMRYLKRPPNPPWFDTYLAHATLYPGYPHDLAFLTSVYTDIPYYKDDMKDWRKSGYTRSEQLYSYNCKDVMSTFEVAQKLMEELKAFGMWEFFAGYVQPLYRILFEMQTTGVRLNTSVRGDLQKLYEGKIEELQKDINERVGHSLNVNSPPQMQKFLYSELKLPVQKHRKRGNVTTDEKALKNLFAKTSNPILEKILELRGYMKLKSTYLDANIDADNRIRTSYGIAETGRLTSSTTAWDTGMQVQNVPQDLRVLFIADEDGMLIKKFDLGQAEFRIVVFLSDCKVFKLALANGEDCFRLVASWVYEIPPDKIVKDQRQVAKKVVHGTDYEMGINTFAVTTGLSVAKSKWVQDKFYQNAPEIKIWQAETKAMVRATRKLTTPFGRVRHFFGRFDDSTYKEAIAHVPQSTCVDTMNQGIIQLYYTIKHIDPKSRLLLQLHDEGVIQCQPQHSEELDILIQSIYSYPIKVKGDNLVIPIEIASGETWRDCK